MDCVYSKELYYGDSIGVISLLQEMSVFGLTCLAPKKPPLLGMYSIHLGHPVARLFHKVWMGVIPDQVLAGFYYLTSKTLILPLLLF